MKEHMRFAIAYWHTFCGTGEDPFGPGTQLFPWANGNGAVEPYYTNSTQLPVGYTDDVFEALDLQDSLQSRYTGVTFLHIFLFATGV